MRIELLGTSFTIRTDEDPEYLREVVEHFREKVAEIQRSVGTEDPLKIAILAGILTSDELLKRTGSERRSAGEAGRMADRMIEELTDALGAGNAQELP